MLLFTTSAFAGPIQIMIENQYLNLDVSPIIENGRTLVPVRAIFESLGATVEWDSVTKTVEGKYNDTIIKLIIDSDTALINEDEVKLDVPAKIVDGRTLVPARFVAESLGAKVDWDESSKTVLINSEKIIVEEKIQPEEPIRGTEGIYIGSTLSDNYHYPSCRWVEKILKENEIWFSSKEDAEQKGYKPCGTCKP